VTASRNVFFLRSMEKAIDLPGWEQARLVDDPDLFHGVGPRLVFEKAGGRSSRDAGVQERPDRASRRREPIYRLSMLLGEFADRADSCGLCSARATSIDVIQSFEEGVSSATAAL